MMVEKVEIDTMGTASIIRRGVANICIPLMALVLVLVLVLVLSALVMVLFKCLDLMFKSSSE